MGAEPRSATPPSWTGESRPASGASARLEIDLSAVGEIDTAGFQLLVLVKREAQRLGKQAHIVAHSEAVRELLDFYNMAAEFGDPLLIPASGV